MLELEPFSSTENIIQQSAAVYEKERYSWILSKIAQLKLTRSKLLTEAEQRVSSSNVSWSEATFTDLFGPDLGRLGEITSRLSRIEKNLKKMAKEARDLNLKIWSFQD